MISTRRKARRPLAFFLAYAATTALVACGGGGSSLPTSDSLDGGAMIEGMVEAAGAGISARSDVRASSGSTSVKVSAVGTTLSTTTDASGRFVLEGLPPGSATLRFEAPGVDATAKVDGLATGRTLRIAVRVNGPTAVLTVLPPTVPPNAPGGPPGDCFSAGAKAEIEGLIVAKETASTLRFGSVTVAQQSKGEFLCQVTDATRIRKGNRTLSLEDLAVGSRVHVSGTGISSANVCEIAAAEIKLQN